MTTTATPTATTPVPRPRETLTRRERAFVDGVRDGLTHDDALALAYACTSAASSSAMLRKLLARPRVIAALGPSQLSRARTPREGLLALLPVLDRELLRLVVDVALEATRREHAAPSGARVLTAFEVLAARDLAAHLEAAGRAAAASVTSPVPPHSASGVDAGPTQERSGEPIPPDATGADPAAVEHGAA